MNRYIGQGLEGAWAQELLFLWSWSAPPSWLGTYSQLRNSDSPCPRVFVELNLATQKVPRVLRALCQEPEIKYLLYCTTPTSPTLISDPLTQQEQWAPSGLLLPVLQSGSCFQHRKMGQLKGPLGHFSSQGSRCCAASCPGYFLWKDGSAHGC